MVLFVKATPTVVGVIYALVAGVVDAVVDSKLIFIAVLSSFCCCCCSW